MASNWPWIIAGKALNFVGLLVQEPCICCQYCCKFASLDYGYDKNGTLEITLVALWLCTVQVNL